MAFWEAIVLIVLIGSIVGVLNTFIKHRGESHRGNAGGEERTLDEVRQLKKRIQVLERVITDNHGSRQLDDEIERLRDR